MKLKGQFPISTEGVPEKNPANLFYNRVISGFHYDVDEPCSLLGYRIFSNLIRTLFTVSEG